MWTDEQERAIAAVRKWLHNPNDKLIFRLFGPAGTGKTTLAKALVGEVEGSVISCAYTGKASSVLRRKGWPNATTIHSLIYSAKDKSRLKLKELESELIELLKGSDPNKDKKADKLREAIREERKAVARPSFQLNEQSTVSDAALVVVDEASMIGQREGEDLCSFGVPILALGDPYQLPPVMDTGYFTNDKRPDFLLTQVHRQATESAILRLATDIREGKGITAGDYGDARVVDAGDLKREDYMAADQIICGTNKTRRILNKRFRLTLGHPAGHPVVGDKLVCRRNDHDMGLLNGTIWYITHVDSLGPDQSIIRIVPEEDRNARPLMVTTHMHWMQDREDELGPWERKQAQEFAYGYAITGHMSQGSQWDNVLVMDESWAFRQDRSKWLYTAVTRAAERLTIART